MKIKKYYLILVVAVGFFSAIASSRAEQSLPNEKPVLINRPHPAFAGIDKLHVTFLRFGITQDKDVPFYNQLEANVKEKLRRAGIELDTPTANNILTVSELRIYVSTLSLEDSQQNVFHIRTALARAVCLKDKRNPVFKADIWQTTPVIQTISAENMAAKVSDVVLEQVEGFINIYKVTNQPGKQPTGVSINETGLLTAPEKQVKKDGNSAAVGYSYVASKSSNIFHKPDCRWAQNISQRNLVTYKSREEAIKAGKRPCKTCNP